MNIINYKIFLLILVTVLLLQSCATNELWQRTKVEEYVQVSMQDISEAELKSKGVTYYKDDTFELFFIEYNSIGKLDNYSLRILLTPLSVPVDVVTAAGSTLVVIAIGSFVPSELPRPSKLGS